MESVVYTLFNIATQIKWISETSILAIENNDTINQVEYDDLFYRKIPFAKAISGICQNHLIILSCSFLDEYEKELTPTKFPYYRERIIEFKKITNPAIKRIKKWSSLKTHRNQIVAHNYRIKGVSIFQYKEPIKYIIPTTNAEYKLLADLIFLISQTFHTIFPDIVNRIDFTKSLRDSLDFKSEKISCKKEFQIIESEINKNKKQHIT